MKPTEFADILDHCLDRLAAGEPLTQILADFPDEAVELRELLPLGQVYQRQQTPVAAPGRQAQGKQRMLAAVDELYPAGDVSWWAWLIGDGRPVVLAGAGLALVALLAILVWVNNLPAPTPIVAGPTQAATGAVAAALPTPLPPATLPGPAITFLDTATPAETATPLPTATLAPTESGAAGGQPEQAAPQLPATTTRLPQATPSPPPAAGGGGGAAGNVAGVATEPNPLVGQWQILTLAADWVLQLDEAGQLRLLTACGELQGVYAVAGRGVSFGPFELVAPAECAAAEMAQLQEVQVQFLLVSEWLLTENNTVALRDSLGDLVLEMQKQTP